MKPSVISWKGSSPIGATRLSSTSIRLFSALLSRGLQLAVWTAISTDTQDHDGATFLPGGLAGAVDHPLFGRVSVHNSCCGRNLDHIPARYVTSSPGRSRAHLSAISRAIAENAGGLSVLCVSWALEYTCTSLLHASINSLALWMASRFR